MVLASNTILAAPNYADVGYYTPTISGGIFQPGAEASYLQDRFFANSARTVNCTLDAAQFIIDLKVLRDIRVVVIPRHNVWLDGSVRLSIYTDAALSNLVITQTQDVYGEIYPWGSIPWEHISLWNGKISPEDSQFFPTPILFVLSAPVIGRYVKIEIIDQSNPAKYIELNRLIIAPGWQPSINYKFGSSIGQSDPTQVSTSLAEVDFYDIREKRRVANISFDYLDEDEALANAFDLKTRLGISGQLFFIYNPEDDANIARTSFTCTMTTLDPLEAAALGFLGTAFALKEAVG